MAERIVTVNINLLRALVAKHFGADSAFALSVHTRNSDITLGAGSILNVDFSIKSKEVTNADNPEAEANSHS